MESLPTEESTSWIVEHMDNSVLTNMWNWMSWWTLGTRLIQTLLVFVLRILHLWWTQMDKIRTDKFELCLTCLSYQTTASKQPIRYVTTVTSIATIHINLEENNSWWPRMAGTYACLSATVYPTYLTDALLINRWSHITMCSLLYLESGSHQI